VLVPGHLPRVLQRARRCPLSTAIWTVGYGSRSFDDVEKTLASNGISTIVDIRPDRHDPVAADFDRSAIEALSDEAGLGYRWMGRMLGNGTDDSVGAAADALVAIAAVSHAAVLHRDPAAEGCSELAALVPALQARGISVLRILPDGDVRPHESPLPFDR